jgi:O-antigen/teichoic acid export membrane protein
MDDTTEEIGIGNSTVKSLSSLFVGKFGGIILTGITFIIVARLLGSSNYGIYTLAISYATLMGAVGTFGIGHYLSKNLAEAKHKKDGRLYSKALINSFALITIISLLFTLLGFGLSSYAATLLSTKVTVSMLLLSSISIFFSMMFGTTYAALIGTGNSNGASISTLISDVLLLAVSAGLVILGYGVIGAIIGLVTSYFSGFIISILILYKDAIKVEGVKMQRIDFDYIKGILKFSAPIAANNIANTAGINNFAILLLGLYASAAIVGNYGAAFIGFTVIVITYSTTTSALLPTLSVAMLKIKEHEKGNESMQKLYSKTLSYSLVLIIPLIIFVGTLSKYFVFLFISSAYSYAPEYLTLICIGVIINLISLFTANFFTAAGKVYEVLKYSLISTAVELIALYILVPKYQAVGLIIAIFFIGNLIDDYQFIHGANKLFQIKTDLKKISYIFIAAGISALIIEAAIFFSIGPLLILIIAILSILFIYPMFLIIFRIINNVMINDAKTATKGIKVIDKIANIGINYLNILIKLFT